MNSAFLHALNERVLVFDGATGTLYQNSGLGREDFTLRDSDDLPSQVRLAAQRLDGAFLEGCNEILVFTRPELVEEIHGRYLAAGSDIIETNTFGNTSIVMGEFGIEDLVYETSLAAAQIAKRATNAFSTADRPRFVCGAIGPGTKLVTLGQTSFDELRATYRTAFVGLIEGGADVLLLETLQDLLMVKATIVGAIEAMAETSQKLPLMVQVTMEQTGTMLLGSEIAAALNMIESFSEVVSFGMNCATGPVEMAPHLRFLSENSTRPISVQPNAGLPVMEKGQGVYKLTPEELAMHHSRFIDEFGVAMVGGCCGTTPAHLKAVASEVAGRPHSANCHWRKVRHLFPGFDFTIRNQEQQEAFKLVGCSSLYQFQPYQQDSSFLIVGEKTNANGSKAFREMLAAENWDGLVELAKDLENEGSHLLDVCAAYVGRNEERDMAELLTRYNKHITVPIMIDSTETNVIEESLKCLAGKPIINSINFEDGEARTLKVLELCRKYGASVVGLTIDEDGMAKTAEKKVEIAERLIERVRAAGLRDYDLFIDCLTFTLGSGDEEFRTSAMATIEAIREIRRRYPFVNTILGVSNVSFGLKPAARHILNSVFLHACIEAGLTSAIVHFSKILPENRVDPDIAKIATDLVYDRRVFAEAGA